MSDSNGDGLNISAVRSNKAQTTVTVRLGGDVLCVEKLDLGKRKAREELVQHVCSDRPGIDGAELDRLLMQLADTQAQQQGKPPPATSGPSREELLDAMSPAARQAARGMLEDPTLISKILGDISAMGVAGEKELSLTVYLMGVSRLLHDPVSGIVQGPTASGKSYTISCVADMFPPEGVILATQMTPQALFYMPPGGLKHKFVVAGERSRVEDDDAAEATRALREMLSTGKLSKLIPMKIDGVMKTVLIEQEGPISYVESTTLTHVFEEDANRCLLLTTDERPEQTRRILTTIAAKYASNGAAGTNAVVEKHYAIQRMLEQLPVLIPFAGRLSDRFDPERVEARRAFPHLLSVIQASALLHQFQRQRDSDGYILAEANDYHLARWLLSGPLGRQLGGGLSDQAKRFIERLQQTVGNEPFDTRQARHHIKGCKSSMYGWLNELAEVGLAKVIEPPRGPKPAIWQFVGTAADIAEHSILPPTEELFP